MAKIHDLLHLVWRRIDPGGIVGTSVEDNNRAVWSCATWSKNGSCNKKVPQICHETIEVQPQRLGAVIPVSANLKSDEMRVI